MLHIRKAKITDFEEIMNIYAIAQDFMIESGNPNQWGHFYPKNYLIKDDIKRQISYLVCDDEVPHGVFVVADGAEPTYDYIENGEWINDDAYVTLHRIAGDGEVHGIFDCALKYCKGMSDNIRIDTHKSNLVMRNLIEKRGFQKCGIIYVADGTPRIAYQWVKK